MNASSGSTPAGSFHGAGTTCVRQGMDGRHRAEQPGRESQAALASAYGAEDCAH